MSEFNIAGIQQIGVGTVDFRKSWNWFIDMKKRDPKKPLPKFMFRMMGLVSREKIR